MTLFARLGLEWLEEVDQFMLRCPHHGWQPWVRACPCVLAPTTRIVHRPRYRPTVGPGGMTSVTEMEAVIEGVYDDRRPAAIATMDGVFCQMDLDAIRANRVAIEDFEPACYQCLALVTAIH